MSRDVRVYLADILESISKIEQYTEKISRNEFTANAQVQDAVYRRLEVIGEAVKGIPEEVRRKYPKIAWKEIAGLRDVLIHGYFGVRPERIWKLVEHDLPDLKTQIALVSQDFDKL